MKRLLLYFILMANSVAFSQIAFSSFSTSNIADNSASLNAYVTINCANGGNFHAQYSTSSSFSSFTNATGGSVSVSYARTINISGLTPGTIYYWRYYGNLGTGCNQTVVYSPIQTFTTTNTVPAVPTISNIVVNNGVISYTLTPNNAATTSLVRYGSASNNLPYSVPGFSAPVGAATPGSVDISGVLQLGNVYFYQIEATNSAGTTSSAVGSFYYGSYSPEYTFDNTYNNIYGTNPFSSNSGTSFTTDRHGVANGALNINNTGTTATITGLPYGATARTVSLWVKLNAFNGLGYNFIYCYGSSSNFNGVYINGGSVNYFAPSSSHTITNLNGTEWNHFVFVYDGSNSKIYKNGTLLGTSARSWFTANNNDLFTLGLTESGVAGYFNGAIDDLKIYNYAVTDAQVVNLFNNNTLANQEISPKQKALIYPNPASDMVTIEMEDVLESVEIYSLQGQKVLVTDSKQIVVSNLSKGVYLIKVKGQNNSVSVQKLVIK